MARGSIVWLCQVCGTKKMRSVCRHNGAYSIIDPVQHCDSEHGRVVNGQMWEKVSSTRREVAEALPLRAILEDTIQGYMNAKRSAGIRRANSPGNVP